jgi:hypothetical protein
MRGEAKVVMLQTWLCSFHAASLQSSSRKAAVQDRRKNCMCTEVDWLPIFGKVNGDFFEFAGSCQIGVPEGRRG